MTKNKIIIAEKGKVFQVSGTNVILSDDKCVWGTDNKIYFTEKGWKKYKQKLEEVPIIVDEMRDLS